VQKTALQIVQILQNHGFISYFAGGSVRDMLMGLLPQDFDIATNAKPEEIQKLFDRTFEIGKDFGVILTHINGHNFEIATFRKDLEYLDGRRPSKVHFCSAKEDALRRDFTINGIFYDPIKDEIHDYVNGQKDLKEKLIRFIGDPEKRIKEDHLRIIRAVRFKNLLKFQYDPKTYQALKKYFKLSAKVTGERLNQELNKMIKSNFMINCLQDMDDLGILKEILPEIKEMHGIAQPSEFHHEGDVWIHSFKSYQALKNNASLHLKWATLLHDIAKPKTYEYRTKNSGLRAKKGTVILACPESSQRIRFDQHAEKSKIIIKKILKRLKFSRKDIDHITWLTSHHMIMENLIEMPKGRQRHWFLHEWFPELLELFRVDIEGTDPSEFTLYNRIQTLYNDFLEHLEKNKPQLKNYLNGEEIMKILKIPAGPEIGKILQDLKEKQLAHEIKSKDEAVEWIKSKTVKL